MQDSKSLWKWKSQFHFPEAMKVQCQGMKSQLSHSCPGTAQHTAAPEAWEGSQGHRHSHLPVPSVPPKYHSHRGIHLGKHGQCDRLTPTHSPCEGQAEGLIAGWGSRSQGGSLAGELREEPVSSAARESCPSRQWPPHSVREGKACSTTAPSAPRCHLLWGKRKKRRLWATPPNAL